MQVTFKQLRYFVAAGETLSVTRAARQTNVSQPSISAAVAQLEAALGLQLFVRHHAQGLSPTPAGRRLLAEAKRLMVQVEDFESFASELGQTLAGTLAIGCFYTVAPLVVPELIRNFTRAYPSARIDCQEGHQEELLTALREGRFEMALTYDLEGGPDLTFEPLADYPPYAIVSADHRLARRRTVRLAELAAEPMILLDWPFSRDYFRSLFQTIGVEPLIARRTNSFDMIRGLVANGFGYALLNAPSGNQQAPDGKPYKILALKEDLQPLRLGLLRLARHQPTRLATAFAGHCQATLKSI